MRKEKELSEKEKKRLERYKEQSERLKKDGYEEHRLTINAVIGNIISIIIALPLVAILILLYYLINKELKFEFPGLMIFYIVLAINFVVGLPVHEFIHGLTHAAFAKNGFKDVEFGIIWKALTPYCVCLVPEKKNQYIISMLMPCIVLGILVSVIGLFFKSSILFFSGLLQIILAGGDFQVILLILINKSNKKEQLFFDHPTEVGSVLFDR